VGWKGLIMDPRPRRIGQYPQGTRKSPRVPHRDPRSGPPHCYRTAGPHYSTVHFRPHFLVRNRSPHFGKPDPPPNGLRPFHAPRLQKHHLG
jgi:hypothetical protein